MPTTKQDKEFSEEISSNVDTIVNTTALDTAISWIGNNLSPEDVFSERQLSDWSEANGYTKE